MTALSNANESERSADEVVSLFMNEDMKKAGRMKICCLKHRRGAEFAPFEAHIDLQSKRIRDIVDIKGDPASEGVLDVIDVSQLVDQ